MASRLLFGLLVALLVTLPIATPAWAAHDSEHFQCYAAAARRGGSWPRILRVILHAMVL